MWILFRPLHFSTVGSWGIRPSSTSTLSGTDHQCFVRDTSNICHELETVSLTIKARDNDNRTVLEALKCLPAMLGSMANLGGLKLRLLTDDDEDHLINHSYWFAHKTIFPKVGQWLQLIDLEIGGLAIDDSELVHSLSKSLPNLQRLGLAFIDLPDGSWEGVVEGLRRHARLHHFNLGNGSGVLIQRNGV